MTSDLVSLPLTEIRDVLPCLKALSENGRVTTILRWITYNLGNHFTDVVHSLSATRALPSIYGHTLTKINAQINALISLRATLYDHLPKEWGHIDWTDLGHRQNSIVMITSTPMLCRSTLAEVDEANKKLFAQSSTLQSLVALLTKVRKGQAKKVQDIVIKPNQYMWLPSTLLFNTCFAAPYPFRWYAALFRDAIHVLIYHDRNE